MKKTTIIIILSFVIALLFATQVWAWVRILGAFYVNDYLSLDSVEQLFLSVFLFKTGLECFVVVLIPAAILFYVSRTELKGWSVFFSYLYLSLVLSVIYLGYLVGFPNINYVFLQMQWLVYLVAGIVGACVFYGVLQLFLRYEKNNKNEEAVNLNRRRYLVSGTATVAGGTALTGSLAGPFNVWRHSDDYMDVDLSKLKEEQVLRVNIDRRPVWVVKRTKAMIEQLTQDTSDLYDPDSMNSIQPDNMRKYYRSLKPEYFVAYGICTHLGCSPTYRPRGMPEYDKIDITNKAVFFCPCHAGLFDMAGRVFKGTPPPTNLKVPNYEFVSDDVIRIFYPSLIDVWLNY